MTFIGMLERSAGATPHRTPGAAGPSLGRQPIGPSGIASPSLRLRPAVPQSIGVLAMFSTAGRGPHPITLSAGSCITGSKPPMLPRVRTSVVQSQPTTLLPVWLSMADLPLWKKPPGSATGVLLGKSIATSTNCLVMLAIQASWKKSAQIADNALRGISCMTATNCAILLTMRASMVFRHDAAHLEARAFLCGSTRTINFCKTSARGRGRPSSQAALRLLSGRSPLASPRRAAAIARSPGFASRQPSTSMLSGFSGPLGCSKSQRVNDSRQSSKRE
mmetsp:Transcript_5868/g.17468  ORF Transcript_5868/g.17468 Transcript_5868/m.17468 type:complete len:276 (+) Transcript_5868:575-1402(+)